MKILPALFLAFSAWAGVSQAADMTASEAFNQGKIFGNAGKTNASGLVNSTSGASNVPGYNTNAPESSHYGGGKSQLGIAGTNKLTECKTHVAGNAYDQQECDVINFLSRNQSVRPIVPVAKNDPIIRGSAPIIKKPGTAPAADTGQVCRNVTQNNPGEYVTETCTTARKTNFSTCRNTLHIKIQWHYSCPAYTVEGPTPVPGSTSVPPENICKLKIPKDVYKCDEGFSGPDAQQQCLNNQTGQKKPATWSVEYEERTTTASSRPEIIDQWDNQCANKEMRSNPEYKPWPECQETNRACSQPQETRYFDGVAVNRPCWQWQKEFACLTQDSDYDCGPRAHGNCALIQTTCLEKAVDGECSITEESYRCEKTPPSITTREVCEPSAFCQSGDAGCFSTERQPDQDFGQAVAMMEATREAGVYGVNKDKIEIFKGYKEECTIKVFGGTVLKSCCGSLGGGSALTNNSVLTNVAAQVGSEAIRVGSSYMYDALYSSVDGSLLAKGMDAIKKWSGGGLFGGDKVFNPTLSFYGFTFEFTFANGFQFVSFDPYSFAFQVGMAVVQEWLSCPQNEQILGIKRGENLCVHVGTRCSRKLKIIGTCLEKKEAHCCFNSLLGKLINRQGRAQLGMSMSECGGFNEHQLQALDFAAMDLSEFIQKIVPAKVDLEKNIDRAGKSVADRVKNYYDQDSP